MSHARIPYPLPRRLVSVLLLAALGGCGEGGTAPVEGGGRSEALRPSANVSTTSTMPVVLCPDISLSCYVGADAALIVLPGGSPPSQVILAPSLINVVATRLPPLSSAAGLRFTLLGPLANPGTLTLKTGGNLRNDTPGAQYTIQLAGCITPDGIVDLAGAASCPITDDSGRTFPNFSALSREMGRDALEFVYLLLNPQGSTGQATSYSLVNIEIPQRLK
jgi:hypothetical protein